MTRGEYFGLACFLIAAGLLLRFGPWHVPLVLHHRGGEVLWGAMIFFLGMAARPAGWAVRSVLVASLLICVAVEGSRLLAVGLLETFRQTVAGEVLLGRIWDPINPFVDALGVLLAVLFVGIVRRAKTKKPVEQGVQRAGQRGLSAQEED